MDEARKPEVGFYQLKQWPLERALPRLLERAAGAGMRALVRCGSKARVDSLNALLWTYDPASFLVHGGPEDGDPAGQPIYLTVDDGNPNEASVLILVDGLEADDLGSFERCLDIFDGKDADALGAARARWTARKDAGYALTYWAQTDQGRWEKQG
jgi:DNA polymerase-3 subunit chi